MNYINYFHYNKIWFYQVTDTPKEKCSVDELENIERYSIAPTRVKTNHEMRLFLSEKFNPQRKKYSFSKMIVTYQKRNSFSEKHREQISKKNKPFKRGRIKPMAALQSIAIEELVEE